MVSIGVQGFDILHPTHVRVEEIYARIPSGIGVIKRHVLDSIHDHIRPCPPRLRRLRRPPVWHIEARGDGDLAPVDSRHLHMLLLHSIAAAWSASLERKSADGIADDHAACIRSIVQLIKYENGSDSETRCGIQGDLCRAFVVTGRPIRAVASAWLYLRTAHPIPCRAHYAYVCA